MQGTLVGHLIRLLSRQRLLKHPEESSTSTWKLDGTDTVGWYGPEDTENPKNWPLAKKVTVSFVMVLLTTIISAGGPLGVAGTSDIAKTFDVSEVVATLGLSTYLAGYGLGVMVSSPIGEVPKIGRTPVFLSTFTVFTALQVPTALSVNIGMFLSLRFLAAFIGSPCLALGSATFPDMWPAHQLGYGLGSWDAATIVGPMLGPVIGNVTAEKLGWRWTIWVLFCAAGFMLIVLAIALPETNPDNILYRRARRLRRITHNKNLKSEAEKRAKSANPKRLAAETLARPFILALREPIVLALDLYMALSYALFYTWTQSFPFVFEEVYGFSAAKEGYTFLGILVGTIVTLAVYCFYFKYYESPKLLSESLSDKSSNSLEKNNTGSEQIPRPEMRLLPAMFGAWWIPICLFWFGWTSWPDIHWMCPLVASSTFANADFCLFIAIAAYLHNAYPDYIASVMAGNALIRSMFGAGFVVFASGMYSQLGIAWASSLLGFLGCAFLPIPFLLYKYGGRIRKASKYARHDDD